MKHLQTIWLIMAQFKAFTRGRLHPTLPLAVKRLWSSHSGKAQLSKKGKPDYMTQHQNGGQIQISGECCCKPFYQYYCAHISFEQIHAMHEYLIHFISQLLTLTQPIIPEDQFDFPSFL